jgi:hypothetical protein
MPVLRCLVSVADSDGVRHVVGGSLFEAAAAGVAAFRRESWATVALTRNATVRVEVQPLPIVHDMPLRTIEGWINAPATSPR